MHAVSMDSLARVDTLVERCGYAAAALTVLPIPGSEIVGVMPLHVGMVVGIANHYGRTITRESAAELLLQVGATVGLSLVGSRIATTAAKVVLPGFGGLIAAPFTFASTLAIGAVAKAYFANGGALSDRQMRDVYRSTVASARTTFDRRQARSDDAVNMAKAATEQGQRERDKTATAPTRPTSTALERLQKAQELLAAGLISQQEYDQLKQRIIADI